VNNTGRKGGSGVRGTTLDHHNIRLQALLCDKREVQRPQLALVCSRKNSLYCTLNFQRIAEMKKRVLQAYSATLFPQILVKCSVW
jgi:hypothetical protein